MGQSTRPHVQSSVAPSLATSSKEADGWDDDGDDWEAFNEDKPKPPAEPARKSIPPPANNSKDLPMPSLAKLSMKPTNSSSSIASAAPSKQDSWNDGADDWSNTKFTPVNEDTDKNSRMDEAKRKREERRIQRLKEIEAKRAANKTGPMKLGQKDNTMFDELQ